MAETFTYKQKITTADVIGGKPTKVVDISATQFLYDVYGSIRGATAEETQYGPYIRFQGDFEAVNMNKEFIRAKSLILPSLGENMMWDAISGYLSEGVDVIRDDRKVGTKYEMKGEKGVDFAIRISTTPSEGPTGYAFEVKPIVQTSSHDPFAHLRQQTAGAPKVENKSGGSAKGKSGGDSSESDTESGK